jgi:hypothetical protein
MGIPTIFLAIAILPALATAQPAPRVVHLWECGAPGFESRKDELEQLRDRWFKNIHNPSVTVSWLAPPLLWLVAA